MSEAFFVLELEGEIRMQKTPPGPIQTASAIHRLLELIAKRIVNGNSCDPRQPRQRAGTRQNPQPGRKAKSSKAD